MLSSTEDLPVILELPGATIRSAVWNEMAVVHVKLAKGSDFTPILKGLPDDLCQCPHWGYILSGSITIRYKDGREETVRAGDLWHTPPGHTGWCDEDTDYLEFSPKEEFDHVLAHIKEKLQNA